MGPPAAVQVLRESLYRGADEVILLTDKAFAGADTLATSYALSLAVEKLGGADLVLCGRQAIDGDTAQVGPQTAEKLGYPQITCVSRIDELTAPVVVLVKQVPDTANVTGEAMKEDGTINRAALPAVFNPEDLNALEEALKLKDRHGARVTVVTMGPPAAVQVLRESLYRGADEVILLTDQRVRRRRHAGDELRAVAGRARSSAAPTSCSAAARRSTATPPRSARRRPRSWATRRSPASAASTSWRRRRTAKPAPAASPPRAASRAASRRSPARCRACSPSPARPTTRARRASSWS